MRMKKNMILMLVVVIACISLIGAGGILIACGVDKIGTTAVYMGAYTVAFTTIAIFVYVIAKTVELHRKLKKLRRR